MIGIRFKWINLGFFSIGRVILTTFLKATKDLLQNHMHLPQPLPALTRFRMAEFAIVWQIFEARRHNTNFNKQQPLGNIAPANFVGLAGSLRSSRHYFLHRYVNDQNAGNRIDILLDSHDQNTVFHRTGQSFRVSIQSGLVDTAGAREQLEALLLVCYRLRNNLFHGQKWLGDIAGQRNNFVNAIDVLGRAASGPP